MIIFLKSFGNEDVLTHTMTLIERAVFLEPINIKYVCEQAFQCLLLSISDENQLISVKNLIVFSYKSLNRPYVRSSAPLQERYQNG